jgi:hypothetical protein
MCQQYDKAVQTVLDYLVEKVFPKRSARISDARPRNSKDIFKQGLLSIPLRLLERGSTL